MRLHRLEITAFGPFSGTEVIDFDTLSDAGLFLIQGRTGAGKTSVLDAVCFALYGQVPGARNAVKGLRSDHAPAGLAPRVVLETTIRGRRLRVTRSPAWERPKLRGSGTTGEHAKVLLEEYADGEWTGLSARLDEAGDLISRLLGMNATQFCQVALLPQGEFAGFLRAGAEERRKVLERLFATEVFTQVEKWLAERRAATRREAAELSAAASSIADRIAETTGADAPREAVPLVPEPRQGAPRAVRRRRRWRPLTSCPPGPRNSRASTTRSWPSPKGSAPTPRRRSRPRGPTPNAAATSPNGSAGTPTPWPAARPCSNAPRSAPGSPRGSTPPRAPTASWR
ncbi:AAA family ATPase [Actinomadura yumaensis]|uniref:AAA family ATPase n=1 Tax=Actinomadura yumaensis TaxID=111807 RepID=UPI00361B24C5